MVKLKSYADYLSSILGDGKYQKLALNAGHDCPNRNGTLSYGGCIYCSNTSFSPSYCHTGATLEEQLQAGRAFFGRKYKNMRWLPYFQTFTSTNADIEALRRQYEYMSECEDVAALVISTRPDSLPDDVVSLLASLSKPVIVEIGAESSHNSTLSILNRHHTWERVQDACSRCAEAGLHVGLHLIAGLPEETDDDLLVTIDRSCLLPIESIKLHHLQILRGTRLAHMLEKGEITVPVLTLDHYLDLCVNIVRRVPENIFIERFIAQAPDADLLSPRWGLKNYQFMHLLKKRLENQR